VGTKLYVGNLSYNTTENSLKEAFSANGREVSSVSIVMDRETGRSRGFAFVEFATPEAASQAMQELDGQSVDGRMLRISEAREREPRGRSFGPPGPGGPGAGPGSGPGGPGGPPSSGAYRPTGTGGPAPRFGANAPAAGTKRKPDGRNRDREGAGDKKQRRRNDDDGW